MTIDPQRLQIRVTEGEGWLRRWEATVPADLVHRQRALTRRKLAGRVSLPGFRKGRVPVQILEQHFGLVLDDEVTEALVKDVVAVALEGPGVQLISAVTLERADKEPGGDLQIVISGEIEPEIVFQRTGGFLVQQPDVPPIANDQVQDVLAGIRREQGIWRPLEEGFPESGDRVSVTLWTLDDEDSEGSPYDFVLGQGDAIPDVERAIQELEVGTGGDFLVRLPSEGSNETSEAKDNHLRIQLHSRKVLDLPDLDDDFAQSLGYDDLEAIEDFARSRLEEKATADAERWVGDRLLEQLIEANPFPLPTSTVERFLEVGASEDRLAGVGRERPADFYLARLVGTSWPWIAQRAASLGDASRTLAERLIRSEIAIDALARTHELTVTDSEVEDRHTELREQGVGASPEEKLRILNEQEAVRRKMVRERVFAFLKEQSTIQAPG